jgi:uncharacterized protein (TIGR02001 family)
LVLSQQFQGNQMKRVSLLLLGLVAISCGAMAEEAQNELSGNIGLVSQYRYRGISQSRGAPALQGGADFNSASGLYIGTWGSTINWIKDSGPNGKGPAETDFYGGYKFKVAGFESDVGLLRYQYFGNNLADLSSSFTNPNTNEWYGSITTGVLTSKYSRSFSNLFGNVNSNGSSYVEFSANFELADGYSVVPHLGHQTVANNTNFSYTDYSLAVNKDMGNGLVGNVTAITTNAKYSTAAGGGYSYAQTTYDPTKSTLVLGLKYSF